MPLPSLNNVSGSFASNFSTPAQDLILEMPAEAQLQKADKVKASLLILAFDDATGSFNGKILREISRGGVITKRSEKVKGELKDENPGSIPPLGFRFSFSSETSSLRIDYDAAAFQTDNRGRIYIAGFYTRNQLTSAPPAGVGPFPFFAVLNLPPA